MARVPDLKPPWYTMDDAKKQLFDFWEKRLEAEGLGIVGRGPNPYQSGTVGHDKITRQAKASYYRAVSSAAASHQFDSEVDEVVMTMVGQGSSMVDVCKELKCLRMPRTRRTVRFIVRRYESLWKIRSRRDVEK